MKAFVRYSVMQLALVSLLVNVLFAFAVDYSQRDGASLDGLPIPLCIAGAVSTGPDGQPSHGSSPFSCGICVLLAQGFASLDIPIPPSLPLRHVLPKTVSLHGVEVSIWAQMAFVHAFARAPPVA